jgi:hypothetical protein
MQRLGRTPAVLAWIALATLLAACSGPAATTTADSSATPGGSSSNDGAACNLSGFLAAQHAHVNHAEVTLCGTVDRVRPIRRTRSGVHRVFSVDVGGGDTIAIEANVDIMGNFPIHTGEPTTIRGEYYYDNDGREGVHWTHRTDRGPHPPGYVILDGRRYD